MRIAANGDDFVFSNKEWSPFGASDIGFCLGINPGSEIFSTGRFSD